MEHATPRLSCLPFPWSKGGRPNKYGSTSGVEAGGLTSVDGTLWISIVQLTRGEHIHTTKDTL